MVGRRKYRIKRHDVIGRHRIEGIRSGYRQPPLILSVYSSQ